VSKKKLAPPKPARKPRADAKRNRERILEAAKEVFTRVGAAASLDDIARRSGIGSGTLYRHFPTRDRSPSIPPRAASTTFSSKSIFVRGVLLNSKPSDIGGQEKQEKYTHWSFAGNSKVLDDPGIIVARGRHL
jgi:hypothetical protein